MAAIGFASGRLALPRVSRREALMPALALAHGAALCLFPSAAAIALGVWWNSNTISHNFIHRPFFRGRAANALFGAYLSVLLGIPQLWWRERHLAHHAKKAGSKNRRRRRYVFVERASGLPCRHSWRHPSRLADARKKAGMAGREAHSTGQAHH